MSEHPTAIRFTWRGRAALGVLTGHAILLLFPPLPPIVKGSIWSYILSILAVVFAAMETHHLYPALLRRWRDARPARRALTGAGTVIGLYTTALLIRAASPGVFSRFSREEGLWEPITLACYSCSFIVVWRTGSLLTGVDRKHFRLIAAGFAFFVLEEVDYFSIFGPLVGRVGGQYAGTLHDLINIAAHGALTAEAGLLVVFGIVVVIALLVRFGFIQIRQIYQSLFSRSGIWLAAGFSLLLLALFKEAGLLGQFLGRALPEEATEMAGALCLGLFALEVSSAATRIEHAQNV